ncbi:MAG: trypsin-like peptidase domain-containing protein [Fuerstiella sp.]
MNLIAMLMLAADPNGQPMPDVVLLDFTAGYCQPCQQMVPVLQRMERDRFPIRKIDITENPDVSRQYRVDRIPTLILLVEGKEAQRFVGLTTEDELRRAMNDAARKLDMQRKAAAPPEESQPASFEDFVDSQPQPPPAEKETVAAAEPEAPRSGIRGVFDRMKRGLGGGAENTADRDRLERPDFRAQSPDEQPAPVNNSLAMRATVRVRLDDGEFKDVGTGTIVHSTAGQSTILTCAHIFKEVSGQGSVEVEVFRNGEVLKYPATVVGGDHDSDVALIQIRNTSPLPVAPLLNGKLNLQKKQPVFSIGCNAGNMPTQLDMEVVKVNFFNGPENIVCSIDPVQGRSGGGLFNGDGQLIGVCSGAFRDTKEGLYTGVGAVRKLINELKLNTLFEEKTAGFSTTASTESSAASAEVAATAPSAASPFTEEPDLFAQMFDENAQAFSGDAAPSASPFDQQPEPPAPGSGNSFSATPARMAMASAPAPETPTEITVIIDSGDPAKGKRVVVIPRPSPWLLQLLTGESDTDGSRMATGGSPDLSRTSSRRTIRKPSSPPPAANTAPRSRAQN